MNSCNCTEITQSFNLLSTSLLMYLDGLKICKCKDELANECLKTQNDITSYHSLVYDKMCNPDKFEQICNTSIYKKIPPSRVQRHCEQILQYKSGVDYDDWFIGWSPFCPTYGFGISRDVYVIDPAAAVPYNSMPVECKTYTIIALVVLYLLCLLIIVANVTVLLVVRLDQYFHTPYGYFKASIAVADLLVGVLVVPALIYNFHEITFSPRPFMNPGEFPIIEKKEKKGFLTTVGFFTILSLSVSVYSLTASSIDRYYSIARPFQYEAKRFFTKTRSLYLIIFIWIFSAVFALLPVINTSTTYAFVSATFILASEKSVTKTNSIFPWSELFKIKQSKMFLEPLQKKFVPPIAVSQHFLNTTVTTNSPSLNVTNISSSTSGMYLILVMYLFTLFLPLVIVWIVNICTIRGFRKKKKKNGRNTFVGTATSISHEDQIPTSSPGVSAASSVLSLHSAILDENGTQENQLTQNQEFQIQTKLNNTTSNGNFLTVPSVSIQGRRSIPRSHIPNQHESTNKFTDSTSPSNRQPVGEKAKRISYKEGDKLAAKMQRILLRMVILFTICLFPAIACLVITILFAPYTDSYSIQRFSVDIKLLQNILAYISSIFLFGNSFVNCIIYTVLGRRFREAAGKMYSGKISSIRQSIRKMSTALEMFSKISKSDSFTPPQVVEYRI